MPVFIFVFAGVLYVALHCVLLLVMILAFVLRLIKDICVWCLKKITPRKFWRERKLDKPSRYF